MAKKAGSSELEYLRGKIRSQEKLIKQMTKRLGRAGKEYSKLAANVDIQPDKVEVEEPEEKIKCPICSKRIIVIELGNRIFYNCKSCDYRKALKK